MDTIEEGSHHLQRATINENENQATFIYLPSLGSCQLLHVASVTVFLTYVEGSFQVVVLFSFEQHQDSLSPFLILDATFVSIKHTKRWTDPAFAQCETK